VGSPGGFRVEGNAEKFYMRLQIDLEILKKQGRKGERS